MSHRLKVLIEKVDNMQEQMENKSREMKNSKNQKEMLEIKKKKLQQKQRMPFMGSVGEWTWLRNVSLSQSI